MRDSGWRNDDVTRPGVERMVLDRPPHPARAHDDHVVLRRVVHVHLLHLPDGVSHEVDLDVIEPDALVIVRWSDEAAVVELVADLDQSLHVPRAFGRLRDLGHHLAHGLVLGLECDVGLRHNAD